MLVSNRPITKENLPNIGQNMHNILTKRILINVLSV